MIKLVQAKATQELYHYEITVANDFVSSVDQLERYLQNPGETLKEKAKEFNTTIEAKQARNDLIRALDRGILDKDGKLEVPAGIKFETRFDDTYFAQLLEVLLTYDKTDNIDVKVS